MKFGRSEYTYLTVNRFRAHNVRTGILKDLSLTLMSQVSNMMKRILLVL
jgi:hypothetical protein